MSALRMALVVAATTLGTGCSEGVATPTAPTTGGTEQFSSVLNVTGTASRTFKVDVRGTVVATLAATAPQNIQLGFMVGVPRANGTGCLPNVAINTEASGSPQLSVVADPGELCTQVYDIGTLREPISFTVIVTHP